MIWWRLFLLCYCGYTDKHVIKYQSRSCYGLQAVLQHDHDSSSNARTELLHKWDQIRSFQDRNSDLEALIKLLYKDTMLNKQRWEAAAAETQRFLTNQLLPTTDQVKQAVTALHHCMATEQAAFDQVVLHQMPQQSASGISKSQ